MTYGLKNTIWNCPALIRTKSMHLITFCRPCHHSCHPSQHQMDRHRFRSYLSDIGFGWPSVSPTSNYMMHHFNQISASKPLQAFISQPFQSRRSLGSFVRIRFLIHTFTKDQVSFTYKRTSRVQYMFSMMSCITQNENIFIDKVWEYWLPFIMKRFSHVINAVKIQYAAGLNLTKAFHPIRDGLLYVIVSKDLGPRFLPMPLMDKQNRFKSVLLYKQDRQWVLLWFSYSNLLTLLLLVINQCAELSLMFIAQLHTKMHHWAWDPAHLRTTGHWQSRPIATLPVAQFGFALALADLIGFAFIRFALALPDLIGFDLIRFALALPRPHRIWPHPICLRIWSHPISLALADLIGFDLIRFPLALANLIGFDLIRFGFDMAEQRREPIIGWCGGIGWARRLGFGSQTWLTRTRLIQQDLGHGLGLGPRRRGRRRQRIIMSHMRFLRHQQTSRWKLETIRIRRLLHFLRRWWRWQTFILTSLNQFFWWWCDIWNSLFVAIKLIESYVQFDTNNN